MTKFSIETLVPAGGNYLRGIFVEDIANEDEFIMRLKREMTPSTKAVVTWSPATDHDVDLARRIEAISQNITIEIT